MLTKGYHKMGASSMHGNQAEKPTRQKMSEKLYVRIFRYNIIFRHIRSMPHIVIHCVYRWRLSYTQKQLRELSFA